MLCSDPSEPAAASRRAALLLALALLAGCRAVAPAPEPPAPLVAPEGLAVAVSSFAGGCLSGPLPGLGPDDIEADPRRVFPLHVELWLVAAGPGQVELSEGLEPLVAGAPLVVEADSSESVRGAARLLDGARLASGAAAEAGLAWLRSLPPSEALALSTNDELATRGMTLAIEARLDERVPDPDNFLGEYPRRPPVPKVVELALDCTREPSSGGPRFDWLMGLSSALPPSDPEALTTPEEARYRPGSPRPTTERLAPAPKLVPGDRALVLLPSPFASSRARSVAFYLQLEPSAGDEASPEQLAELGGRLARALERVGSASRGLGRSLDRARGGDFVAETVAGTLARLAPLADAGDDPRPALVFLSGALETPLARDLVLVLERPALDRLVADLVKDSKSNTTAAPFDPRWSLERAAWRELVRALSAGDERSPERRAALGAVALDAAGQLGAFPTLIADVLASVASTDALGARLIAENRIFLEDSSPAARARAFAWLERRGLAPAGFDPLAPRAERREALRLAAESPSEPAAELDP